jgi:hypothetical protein
MIKWLLPWLIILCLCLLALAYWYLSNLHFDP